MPKRGELHHFAKLSDDDVKEMRRLRDENPSIWSYGALAGKFKCGHSTVRDILKKKTRYSLAEAANDLLKVTNGTRQQTN